MTPPRPPIRTPAATEPLPAAAVAVLALVAAVMIALLVSWKLADLDVWQHLRVGKAIWELHRVPLEQVWVWPTYGQPDVLPSWLFRVLLWPFYAVGGLNGVFVWRWLTTLTAFALIWRTARAMGARGPWVFVALVWCAMFYRYRSQPRPETFVAVLAALQMFVLERRRAQGAPAHGIDPAWWVVPIAWLWANAHISYYLGLAITAFHAIDAWWASRHGPSRRPGTLALAFLASGAISFVNPFGWRVLAQPLEYFFVWRHEPIYQLIGELAPIQWSTYMSSGIVPWMILLVGFALWRWRRSGPDFVQLLGLLLFVPQALSTQRFLGYLAFLAAPYFVRDFDAAFESLAARFLRGTWPRTVVAALLAIALPIPSWWARTEFRPSTPGFHWEFVPVAACDWVESHGVRGRAMNSFDYGGYMLWRFWPQKDRLPFMDIHQSGTAIDRSLHAWAGHRPGAWKQLDEERRFDWALIPRTAFNHLADDLDADSSFALVFADDVALLYLRRDGVDSALAARMAYHALPGGSTHLARAGAAAYADSSVERAMRADLRRQAAESRWNAVAHRLLGNLAMSHGAWADAVAELDSAYHVLPDLDGLAEHRKLAHDSLAAVRAREAPPAGP